MFPESGRFAEQGLLHTFSDDGDIPSYPVIHWPERPPGFDIHTHDFDVSSLIYEYIILAVPMYRVHPEGQCNPEVIAMLTAKPEEPEEKDIDPRWAALKDIKLEDNK